jgi:hypothetical protein
MINLFQGQVFDGEYELIRLIDTGGFAEVWEAKYLLAGNTVALKVYPRLDEEGASTIESEYKRLFELQHSNLVNALNFGRFEKYPYLVMRYYDGGNAGSRVGECDEREIAIILQQIGGALKYLHANDIVHQDIKPNNFLLDQRGNYYLADLGLSLKVRNTIRRFTYAGSGSTLSSMHGLTPPSYRAPELMDQHKSDSSPIKATDVWALGASLYEMMTTELPYGELGGLIQKEDSRPTPLPDRYSRELDRLINECLAKEPWDRPTAAKLEKRAQRWMDTGHWYEPEERGGREGDGRKDVIVGDNTRDTRKTVVFNREQGGGTTQGGSAQGGQQQGGGGTERGGGSIDRGGATERGGGATELGRGGNGQMGGGRGQQGQGGGAGMRQGGGGQGGQGGGGGRQQRKQAGQGKIQEDKSTARAGRIAVIVAGGLIVLILILFARPRWRSWFHTHRQTIGLDTTSSYGQHDYSTNNTTTGEPLVVDNPRIDKLPVSSCPPQIRRINRTTNDIQIEFFMMSCIGKLSIYPPGDDRAFYLHTPDRDYKLKDITWKGEGQTVPYNGQPITATFERPDDDVTVFDIREGVSQIEKGLKFFNYKGVHLK